MPSRNAARAAISKASADEVDVVIGAVDQRRLEVDDREAGEHAGVLRELQALFDTPGTYSFGTVPPTTSFSNSKPTAGRQRLEAQLDARVLARTAGLLLVRVVVLGRLG